jgi:hypothetical protein
MRNGGAGVENPILEPEKTITGYALLTYAWVLALSTWGGISELSLKNSDGAHRAV